MRVNDVFLLGADSKPPPPPPNLRDWKGSFCIPDLPLNGQPYWTPSYGCWNDADRAWMRQRYIERNYRMFPYNCAGKPYGEHYPVLSDDPARVRRDLLELRNAGLVPVVFATDDRQPDIMLSSFAANAALIQISVPCWEMNGPLQNDTDRMKRLIIATRQAAPGADCYLHFTPGHSAIGLPEWDAWKWCQLAGTVGLLAQGSNTFAAEPPDVGGRGLESTAVRLAGRTDLGAPIAWAGLNQLTVKFEYGIKDAFDGNVREQPMRDYTVQFLKFAPLVVGYCDGGR